MNILLDINSQQSSFIGKDNEIEHENEGISAT